MYTTFKLQGASCVCRCLLVCLYVYRYMLMLLVFGLPVCLPLYANVVGFWFACMFTAVVYGRIPFV